MSGFLPTVAQEAILVVVGTVVTGSCAYVVNKARKVRTHNLILQGVDGVAEMDGLVGSVEMLNKEVEGNTDAIQDVQDDMSQLKSRISELQEFVSENDESVQQMEEKMEEIHERIEALNRDITQRNNDE